MMFSILQVSLMFFLQVNSVFSQTLPEFTTHPSSKAVEEGTDVTLSCTIDNSDGITIQWIVNETLLDPPNGSYSLSGDSLEISDFNEALSGNYSCLATNGNWTIRSAPADVRMVFLESNYDGLKGDITVKLNDVAVINCIPEYFTHFNSEPELTWLLKLSENTNVAITSSLNNPRTGINGSLYLLSVTQDETYICRLLDPQIGTIEYTTELRIEGSVQAPPLILLSSPQNVLINEEEDAKFECIIGGIPISIITWSTPNITTNAVEQQDGSELLVTTVGSTEEGDYTCEAAGIPDSYTATLTIRDPPYLTSYPPPNLIVTYGDTFTLNCSATGDDIKWMWFHNGEWISSESSIIITNTGLSNTGAYQCYAMNLAGINSSSTLIDVKTIPPSFVQDGILFDQVAFQGRQLNLSCNATGAPVPSYRWLINNDTISEEENNVDFSIPGVLIFSSINTEHQANYTCIAEGKITNDLLIGENRSTAEIMVVEPTIITTQNITSVSSHIGEPFYLNCSVDHDVNKTSVELSWTLNGTMITNNTLLTKISQTHLSVTIPSAAKSHTGNYQCVVKTIYNDRPNLPVPVIESTITSVKVTDAAVPPVVTLIKVINSSVLEVSWTYKGFFENLNEYRIETQIYEEGRNNEWIIQVTLQPQSIETKTIKNITGLLPYTQYIVRVIAVLNNGEEVPSTIYGPSTTEEAEPSGAPFNVIVDGISTSNSSLSIQWTAPNVSTRNGIINDYTIRYWTNDTRDNTVLQVLVGSNNTRYVISGLLSGTEYKIQVAAHTKIGRGPFSETIRETTSPTIGGVAESPSDEFHEKIWFIFICAIVVIVILVTLTALIAALRWRAKRKGKKYPVRNSFYAEDISLTDDVVADYEKRRIEQPPLGFMNGSESMDGSRPNLTPVLPFSHSHGSIRGSLHGSSTHGSLRGYPHPPSYINPPSFEETLKAKMAGNRSASLSLLEKSDRFQLSGSGWSVGHDPKSAFYPNEYISDDITDTDSIGKPRLPEPQDEMSGESDESGVHSHHTTNVGTFTTFV